MRLLLSVVSHCPGALAWWNVELDVLSQAPCCSELPEQASVVMHMDVRLLTGNHSKHLDLHVVLTRGDS